ncbi:hypothetical protein [Pradoshia sp.]
MPDKKTSLWLVSGVAFTIHTDVKANISQLGSANYEGSCFSQPILYINCRHLIWYNTIFVKTNHDL